MLALGFFNNAEKTFPKVRGLEDLGQHQPILVTGWNNSFHILENVLKAQRELTGCAKGEAVERNFV